MKRGGRHIPFGGSRLAVAAGVLALVGLGIHRLTPPADRSERARPAGRASLVAPSRDAPATTAPRTPRNADPALTGANPAEFIESLHEIAWNDDTHSLGRILSALRHADPTVRAAAIEAAVTFSSRDAIPILRDLASRCEDAAEKRRLIEAADYLELPTVLEIHREPR